ncbi:MAG: hypothetical protein LBP54_00190 [Campylobacteraceae bacterium]|jgi:hypothetical protein|nr:hypothetical protein [Campylobacteraceae bacterium]
MKIVLEYKDYNKYMKDIEALVKTAEEYLNTRDENGDRQRNCFFSYPKQNEDFELPYSITNIIKSYSKTIKDSRYRFIRLEVYRGLDNTICERLTANFFSKGQYFDIILDFQQSLFNNDFYKLIEKLKTFVEPQEPAIMSLLKSAGIKISDIEKMAEELKNKPPRRTTCWGLNNKEQE